MNHLKIEVVLVRIVGILLQARRGRRTGSGLFCAFLVALRLTLRPSSSHESLMASCHDLIYSNTFHLARPIGFMRQRLSNHTHKYTRLSERYAIHRQMPWSDTQEVCFRKTHMWNGLTNTHCIRVCFHHTTSKYRAQVLRAFIFYE